MIKERIRKAIIRRMIPLSPFYIMPYFSKKLIVPQNLCNYMIKEVLEPETLRYLDNNAREGDIVVDIGAMVGYFTVFLSDLVGEKGKIISFEPDPYMNKILRANVRLNHLKNVEVLQYAADDKNGQARFFVNHPGRSSLIPLRGVREIIDIPTMKIDELNLEQLDWVKIDTEGTEAAVLRGMRDTLERCNPKIIVEFIPDNAPVDDLLTELEGWEVKGLDHNLLCWKSKAG